MKVRIIVVLIELIILAVIITFCLTLLREAGLAEDVWVLCDPDSFVCVREAPRKTAYAVGGITCGTLMETDGEIKGNYIHVINVHAEDDKGWISRQYIVHSEPKPLYQNATVVSNGRLAARKGVGGKIRKWLNPMDTLKIYWWSDEWCLTNYGYVQTDFLELDGEC